MLCDITYAAEVGYTECYLASDVQSTELTEGMAFVISASTHSLVSILVYVVLPISPSRILKSLLYTYVHNLSNGRE
jgi:hypothetical protein